MKKTSSKLIISIMGISNVNHWLSSSVGEIIEMIPTVTRSVKTFEPIVSETATSVNPLVVALNDATIFGIEGTIAPKVSPTKRGSKEKIVVSEISWSAKK